ncbi:head GIN domain-containing protein [uncultured Marixanthomonas sp.]|uniref:head GIN domain-containing protein n=1 Tax=uncultured Marixanthomonas sp. TaxID=757245 RepID=UPI0030D81579|tara:strand:+ start:99579 stop:100313 length:735 start_codon:yes stop_codon:yes gene_type:complete
MKTLSKSVLIVFLLSITGQQALAQNWNNSKVKGDGNVTTKTVSTGDYDNVHVTGSMDVTLVSGKEGSITVSTDNNIHEHLDISTSGNTLTISVKKGHSISTKKGIDVTVPFQDLSVVKLVGSGDITSTNIIKTDDFETSLVGSGDIILNVESNSFHAKIVGSGDMKLSGNTDDFELKLSGSGDFDGRSFEANATEVYVSGSGDATVSAKESIKARVNGSGDISYKGNPSKSDTKVLGSGTIKSM